MSINTATVSGNLTRDPEMRSTASGVDVLKFSVAVNDRRKNAAGEWEDYPNYIDITVFGSRASYLKSRLAKGTKVCVSGSLRWSQWEKNGEKRSKLEVIANDVEVMAKAEPKPEDDEYTDIDIPF